MTADTEAGGFPARAILGGFAGLAENPFRRERRPKTGTAGSSARIATPASCHYVRSNVTVRQYILFLAI
ncbi:hypothetical protein ACCS96_01465, partial [Rhizobium ruizarguesonis]